MLRGCPTQGSLPVEPPVRGRGVSRGPDDGTQQSDGGGGRRPSEIPLSLLSPRRGSPCPHAAQAPGPVPLHPAPPLLASPRPLSLSLKLSVPPGWARAVLAHGNPLPGSPSRDHPDGATWSRPCPRCPRTGRGGASSGRHGAGSSHAPPVPLRTRRQGAAWDRAGCPVTLGSPRTLNTRATHGTQIACSDPVLHLRPGLTWETTDQRADGGLRSQVSTAQLPSSRLVA